MGFFDFEVIPTFHRFNDRDENTESWLVDHFLDYEDFADNDILFINCGSHEWALQQGEQEEIAQALENLRRFVREGGSLYLSDWAYDLFEVLFPDAVQCFGDGRHPRRR